ncbi:SCO family protein [Lederbergia lenta]|uniref:Electron transport protein SCO1/SenC n=1 Tax=Lederbergia lenta TaxID=1467 RepID=A0A2X4Z9B8_LEDLE|nr:SCO family protein [Lederbergia lenta]MCM3110501.1 SCO family protein [Lederbergia lenta]MEC2323933.1 SCO family protein [Lederbergia lenta]SQI60995.1 electron transport protein SCO1/SenC [Lederbergia lenta]
MKKLSLFILLSIVLILSACSSEKRGTPIEDFNYTNQDGEPFGLKDLEGKVWLADFVYTYCPKECPLMTLHMSQIQQDVIDAGLEDVQFVSFSIDPEIDSPEVLKAYGEGFDADFSTWHFLTGYSQEEIEDYAPKNFKTIVKKPRDDDTVIHGLDFYLMNKQGEIIGNYPAYEDVPFKQILKDIKSAVK